MIDIENMLFTKVKNDLPTTVKTGTMYASVQSEFPYVTLMVMDNSVYEPFIDSARIENAVEIMVEVNVYSNKTSGKKEECKKLIKTIDDTLSGLNLARIFCQPTPNLEDATVFRITARYRAIVDKNLNIYRR
jgi:hypothetical protein